MTDQRANGGQDDGNAAARAELIAAIGSAQLHHAWLIAGPAGLGKADFARAIALRLLAQANERDLPPGLAVPSDCVTAHLFAAGSHPDYRELRRLAKDPEKPEETLARSITIDQVRGLQAMFATRSARRVVLIDSIDDLERAGSNALLKSLEEPPAGTIFLLLSHAPGRLLPTIRSRCRLLRFEPVSDAAVEARVRGEFPDISDEEVRALVRAGDGSPGRALAFAGLDLAALEGDLEDIAREGDRSNAIRLRLAKTLAAKAARERYEAFLARAPSFIAAKAKEAAGDRLRVAIEIYAAANALATVARRQSLDPSATVFEMAGLVARLAGRPGRGGHGSVG